jgi:hypothetical protein
MSTDIPSSPPQMNPSDNRAPLIWGLLASLLPVTTAIVALRFYFRIRYRQVGADDWVTLASLVNMLQPVSLMSTTSANQHRSSSTLQV